MSLITIDKKINAPIFALGASADITVSGTSAQSAAIGTAGENGYYIVRLVATAACRVLTGTNPTAIATSTLFPASTPEPIKLLPGHKIAAIQESAGGKLNYTVLDFIQQ